LLSFRTGLTLRTLVSIRTGLTFASRLAVTSWRSLRFGRRWRTTRRLRRLNARGRWRHFWLLFGSTCRRRRGHRRHFDAQVDSQAVPIAGFWLGWGRRSAGRWFRPRFASRWRGRRLLWRGRLGPQCAGQVVPTRLILWIFHSEDGADCVAAPDALRRCSCQFTISFHSIRLSASGE
jgi:hypothetical protein